MPDAGSPGLVETMRMTADGFQLAAHSPQPRSDVAPDTSERLTASHRPQAVRKAVVPRRAPPQLPVVRYQ